MIAFSAGQGFSGVMMNIIQYIVLGCVHSGNRKKDLDKTAWIYFGISAGCLFLILILLLFQLQTDFFKYYLKPLNDRLKQEKEEKEKKKKEQENKKGEDKKEEETKENKKEIAVSTERDAQLNIKENKTQTNNDTDKLDNKDANTLSVDKNTPANNGPTPKKGDKFHFLKCLKF
jgi:hypothetical protein